MQEVEALTLDDAVSFYDRYYAPNNAVLIVAGDVRPDEVRDLAEKHYGPLEPTPDLSARSRPQEPPQLAERRLTYTDPRIAQPYVIRTYLAPERDSGDQREAAALTLLAEVLGGGQSSELASRLQFGTREALNTGAFYSGTSLDDTTFGLVVVPSPGTSLEEAEAALDRALAAFLADGVDAEQLARIKTQIRASEIYEEDSVRSLADRYGRALTSGLTVEDVEAWPDLLDDVTGEEIVQAAKRVFDRDHAVTGYVSFPAAPPDAPGPARDATPASAAAAPADAGTEAGQ